MKKRLMFINAVIIVAGFAAAFLFAALLMQNQYREELAHRLDATLAVLSAQTEDMEQDPQKLADQTAGHLQTAGQSIRITILDLEGNVIGDSQAPGTKDNHRDRPEIRQAMESGHGSDVRRSETTARSLYYDAMLVDNRFFVRAAMPVSDLDAVLGRMWLVVLGCMAAGILLVCLVIRISLGRALQPVSELTQAARSLAAGDFSARAKGRFQDELRELADAFDLMADNTESAVNQLQTKQDQLEGVLQGMENGVVAVDSTGNLLFLNASAKALLDCPSLKEGGALEGSLLARKVSGAISAALEQGGPVMTSMADRDASYTVYTAPMPGKHARSALAVVADVTRMHKLEQLRSEFVANVTHELKTPLTSIRGSIELLKSADRDAETRNSFYEILDIEAERLQHLIDDMLALSQIENMREDPAADRVSLAESLQKTVARLLPLADKNQVTLELEADPALFVSCAASRLQQLFTNLVENGVKYNAPGGIVRVSAKGSRQMAYIRVEDTGVGIAREHLPRLFERFYRVDAGRSREIGGTGLGLSIVKHLAMLYGGDVSVESELGKGSVFTVRLPLASPLEGF